MHGRDAADRPLAASAVLFGGDPGVAGIDAYTMLAAELPAAPVPTADRRRDGDAPSTWSTRPGWPPPAASPPGGSPPGSSRSTAGGSAPTSPMGTDDLLHGRYVLVRRGKKRFELLVAG